MVARDAVAGLRFSADEAQQFVASTAFHRVGIGGDSAADLFSGNDHVCVFTWLYLFVICTPLVPMLP
jgi:hypothetical protein